MLSVCQPTTLLYPTDVGHILFVCSLLTRRALDWATSVWSKDQPAFPTFTCFLQHFQEVFEHTDYADYALTFRTLAEHTVWVDDTLKLLFRKGFNELLSELACHDEGKSLDQFIDVTIHNDNLISSRRQPRYYTSPLIFLAIKHTQK